MHKGRALLAAGAMLVAAQFLPASADTTPAAPDLPRAGCTHGAVTATAGNGTPSYAGDNSAVLKPNTSLDITGVYARVTDTQLQVYLQINHLNDPSTMQPYEATYRYTVGFKLGAKVFNFVVEQKNPTTGAAAPADSPSYPTWTVSTPTVKIAGSTATFVQKALPAPSYVVFTSPRDKTEAALGNPFNPGDVFTDVTATTEAYTAVQQLKASGDKVTATGDADKINAFDDWCFGPPPTVLNSVTVASPVVYHHATNASAVLTDQDGKALAGKPVTFTIKTATPVSVTGTTDANGLATASFASVGVPAGTYPVVVSFPGEGETYKTSTATGSLTVQAQKTAFTALKVSKPSATTRLVTTTLVDDMSKPVAGVKVDWYVNGKKVASVTTDKTGKAIFKTGKPGQTVQARYAGSAGRLLASASKTAKL